MNDFASSKVNYFCYYAEKKDQPDVTHTILSNKGKHR